jgi:hypothetical protein
MRFIKYPVICALFLILFHSCGKIEKLPPIPAITFTSFEVFDTIVLDNEAKAGRLKFHFEDGDGDLGLNAPEVNSGSDTSNLFFTLLRKNSGSFIPAPDNDPLDPSDYRIPYMERLGQNKILKGTVSITFLYLFYTPVDTIKYEFYIKDRADHLSNTVTTCEIAINLNSLCTGPGN